LRLGDSIDICNLWFPSKAQFRATLKSLFEPDSSSLQICRLAL
jgi:hypothetical protein